MDYTVELDDSDIEQISDESGVDEKYIKKSLELKRADNRYCKNKPPVKTDKSKNNLKILTLFIKNELITFPTIPNFAKIKSVKSPKEDSDKVILCTKTDYPKLKKQDKNTIEKTFDFDLNDMVDYQKFNYILNYVDVDNPSDLEGKFIPTRPISVTNYRCRIDNISYEIHTPKNTIAGKINYKIYRLFMRTKCIERYSDKLSRTNSGRFGYNRNIYLLLTVLLSPLLFIDFNFAIHLISATLFIYVLATVSSLIIGLSEFLTEESSERYYIQKTIHK